MPNRDKGNNNKRGRGRPRKIPSEKVISCCWECGFESPRKFNVLRHHERIHQPTKKWKTCCGRKFMAKSAYYWHCAQFHPNKRKYTIMSEFKYKITRESGDEEIENLENRQFDKRILRRRIDKASETQESNLETREVKSNFFEESEKPKSKGVKIFFSGAIKTVSPELAKIQSDYLTDIDFDSFKLALPSEREVRLRRRNSTKVERFFT